MPKRVVGLGAVAAPTARNAKAHRARHAVLGGIVLAFVGATLQLRAQTIVDLGVLPGGSSLVPNGISADGNVVVGHGNSNGNNSFRPFKWTMSSGLQQLPITPFDEYGIAYGISADGAAVVGAGFFPAGGSEMLRWTASGVESLGFGARASAASRDGSVVVGECAASLGFWRDTNTPYAILDAAYWTQAIGLSHLPGGLGPVDITTDTYGNGAIKSGHLFINFWPIFAYGVSEDGSVAAGKAWFVNPWPGHRTPFIAEMTSRAFVWYSSGAAFSIGVLPGNDYSESLAVSGDGSTVVGFSGNVFGGVNDHAFRWTAAGGMIDLGAGSQARALATTRDGSVIVGDGGSSGAFLWTSNLGAVNLEAWLPTQGIPLNGRRLKEATGISADGRVIVGLWRTSSFAPVRGFRIVLPRSPAICVADTDDGTGNGVPDGGVTIDDLLYFLFAFEQGLLSTDVDDGSSTGTPDGGVTIDDLLYYLARFEAGC